MGPPTRTLYRTHAHLHPYTPCSTRTQVQPLSKETDEALRKWMDKTPAMAVVKGGAKPGTAGSKKKGKDGGKKKKK